MRKDLFDLSVEVSVISNIVTALSCQFENKENTRLTDEAMKTALFGISTYLDRISDELEAYEEREK